MLRCPDLQVEVIVKEGEDDEDVNEALSEILAPEPEYAPAQQAPPQDQWQQQQQQQWGQPPPQWQPDQAQQQQQQQQWGQPPLQQQQQQPQVGHGCLLDPDNTQYIVQLGIKDISSVHQ